MAFTIYTGKSGGTVVVFSGVTMPGWKSITIEENGKPLPSPVDVTDAGDAAYTFVDDPLGGKGDKSCTVTVEGFLSNVDFSGAGGWLQLAKGTCAAQTVTTATGGDEWTQNSMTLKTFTTGAGVAEVMPFTATFTHATLPGAWSKDT